jgi:hypothetical protein
MNYQLSMDEALKLQAKLDAYTKTLSMADALKVQADFDRTGKLPPEAQ